MAEQAELDSRIARLEAALGAASDALEQVQAAPDGGAALEAAQAELEAARQKIATLEQMADDREAALDAAVKRAEAAEAAPAEPATGDAEETAALRAEIDELKAARAQDLAEMKSLLAELEPMLESANA